MKIIYRLWIELRNQTTFHYMFDSYEAVEEWLEKHFKKDNKALDIKIDMFALCDLCKEYKPTDVSNLMKKHGSIYMLCEDCANDYKININKYIYIKEEE